MTLLLVNLLLAALWVLLWGELDFYVVVVGLIGGYFVLWGFTRVVRRDLMRDAYGGWVLDLVRFGGYFIGLLIKSNLMLARVVVTPGFSMSPRIVRFSVDGLNDAQIAALSSAITLTPGTLVVDISRDMKFLYVHAMFAADPGQVRLELEQLRARMERQVFHLEPREPDSVSGREGAPR